MLQLLFPSVSIPVTYLGSSKLGLFPRVQAGRQKTVSKGLGRSQQGVVQRSLGIRGVKTAKHRVHGEGEVRREGEHIRREARLWQPCKTLVRQAPLGTSLHWIWIWS